MKKVRAFIAVITLVAVVLTASCKPPVKTTTKETEIPETTTATTKPPALNPVPTKTVGY